MNCPAALCSTHCLGVTLTTRHVSSFAQLRRAIRGLAELLRWHCLCQIHIMSIAVSSDSQVTLQTWPHMMSATWRHIHLHNGKHIASRNLFQRRTFTRHWQQDLQLRAAYRRALSCKGGCALGGSQVIEDALQDVEDDAAPREAGHKQATDQPSLPGEQTCRQPAIGEPRSASPCQAVILLTRNSSPDVEQTRDCTCIKGYRDAMYAHDFSTCHDLVSKPAKVIIIRSCRPRQCRADTPECIPPMRRPSRHGTHTQSHTNVPSFADCPDLDNAGS